MREIEIEVNGEIVRKDSKIGGVQGEGNATALRIRVDESWQGYGKRIVWRNAQGEDPVAMVLFSAAEGDPLSYETRIPAEALALPGWCSFTLEGYREEDGVHSVALSVRDWLEVKESDSYFIAAEPTANQAQQIMEALGKTEERVQSGVVEAQSWAVGGTGIREGEDSDNAKYYAGQAADSAAECRRSAEAAESARAGAEAAQAAVESAQVGVEVARKGAESAQAKAENARAGAEAGAQEAQSWAVGGTGSREGEDTDNARYYAEQAASLAAASGESAQAAQKACAGAEEIQTAAEAAQVKAEEARAAAEIAQAEAEAAQAAARTAQENAEKARTGAEEAEAGADTARSLSEAARDRAETARDRAQAAAAMAEKSRQAVEDLGVEAVAGDAVAAVEKTVDGEGRVTLTFTLPKGDRGEKGDKGDQGDPGAGDMQAAVYDPQGRETDIYAYVDGLVGDVERVLDGILNGTGERTNA